MFPLIEQINFTLAHPAGPGDWDTDKTGDYVAVRDCQRMGVLAVTAAGTAGDDPNLVLYEASDASGTGAAALAVITTYWTKQAATDLSGTGTWTKNTQSAGSQIDGNATSAEQVWACYFEVDPATLSDGFDFIRVDGTLDASGGAQYGCLWYIPIGMKYAGATAPSIIA